MDHSSSSAPIKSILWITVVNRKRRNSKPPSSDVAGDELHSQENPTTTEASESSENVKKGKKKKKKKKGKKVTVSDNENEEEADLATFATNVTVWDGSEKCKGVSEGPHRCIEMMPYVYLVFGLAVIAFVSIKLALLDLPEINYHNS